MPQQDRGAGLVRLHSGERAVGTSISNSLPTGRSKALRRITRIGPPWLTTNQCCLRASPIRSPKATHTPLPEAAIACYCHYRQPSSSNPSGTMGEAVHRAPAGRRVHCERRRSEETVLYQLV